MRTSWRFARDLGRVDCRVEDLALFPAGAAHEDAADRFSARVLGDRRPRALRRFVVGVGVNGQQTEGVVASLMCAHATLRSRAPGSERRSFDPPDVTYLAHPGPAPGRRPDPPHHRMPCSSSESGRWCREYASSTSRWARSIWDRSSRPPEPRPTLYVRPRPRLEAPTSVTPSARSAERDLQRVTSGDSEDEHHLVADGLHHPAAELDATVSWSRALRIGRRANRARHLRASG